MVIAASWKSGVEGRPGTLTKKTWLGKLLVADQPTGAVNGVAEAGNNYSAVVEIARFRALVPIAGALATCHKYDDIVYPFDCGGGASWSRAL